MIINFRNTRKKIIKQTKRLCDIFRLLKSSFHKYHAIIAIFYILILNNFWFSQKVLGETLRHLVLTDQNKNVLRSSVHHITYYTNLFIRKVN